MNEFEQHDTTWDDRLQELLDGDVEFAERVSIESHISLCTRCRRRYSKLKRLDAQLSTKLRSSHLDATFDRQIFARIEALEAHGRDHARRRAEQELNENLATLARDWRRRLLLLVTGAIGGITIALAVVGWADASGISAELLSQIQRLGAADTSFRAVMTMLTGAVAGAGISGWFAKSLR